MGSDSQASTLRKKYSNNGSVRLRGEVLAANTAQTVQAVLAQLHLLPASDLRAVLYGHPKLRAVRALEEWPAMVQAESVHLRPKEVEADSGRAASDKVDQRCAVTG